MTLRLKIVLHDIMNKINDSFARILSSEISAKKNVIAVKDYIPSCKWLPICR